MNDADLPSINLDELRLVPDWLRENTPPPSKQYASYDRPIDDDEQTRRRPRPGGGGGDRRDPRDNRGGGDRRGGPGRPDRPTRGAPAGRREMPRQDRESFQPPVAAAPIRVEFLPDERCMTSIIKQIRSTHLAYPLFSLARMFLQEPARHYLQLSLVPGTTPPGTALHQLGDDGPVTMSRAPLEATAFDALKDRYYQEESVQKEPPKGNFTNVARERLSGTLLGPTNYHGYQPALRALYESRYSRRMSFEDYRRNIEVSSDPALIERWKEDARTVTTISTVGVEPPTVFSSVAEARAHFRQHHLESALHQGMSFRLHGSVGRGLPEPAVMQAIREAHERELRYPAQFVQLLRQGLQNAGLHIFKHRKRIVYVAATRPTPFVPSSGAVTENISLILETITEFPLCTRKMLAERVLSKKRGDKTRRLGREALPARETEPPAAIPPTQAEAEPADTTPADEPTPATAPEPAPMEAQVAAETDGTTVAAPIPAEQPGDEASRAKAALAADIRFLVQAGHIIEFHNGTFDLPLPPKPKEEPPKKNRAASAPTREDLAPDIGSDPAMVSEGGTDFGGPDEPVTPAAVAGTQPPKMEPSSERAAEQPPAVDQAPKTGARSVEADTGVEAVNGGTAPVEADPVEARPSEEQA